MRIKPLVGLDNITLGMSKTEVLELLGKPNEKENIEQVDNTCDHNWIYLKLGLEIQFDQENDYCLSSIDVCSSKALLEGKKPIGKKESDLLKLFPQLELGDDFEELGKDYNYPKKELMFWLTDGIVSHITIFPEYDETGEVPI